MKNYQIIILLFIFTVFVTVKTNRCQSLSGSRLGCLGPAFTAIADDGTSINMNPAGLVLLQRQELNLFYTSLYGMDINRSYLSYNLPIRDIYAIGVDWGYTGSDDEDLNYSQNQFGLAFSYKWNDLLFGVKGSYHRTNTSWNEINYDKGGGAAFHAGILYLLNSKLRFGFSAQNLLNYVKYGDEDSEDLDKFRYQAGVNYQLIPSLNIAGAFYENGISLAGEYWWRRQYALRLGYKEPLWMESEIQDIYKESFFSKINIGFGYQYKFIRLDYYYHHHVHLGNNHYFTMTLFYNPHVISIKDATVSYQPIFKSLYRYYGDKPVINVVLKNSSEDPQPVNLKILFPYLMNDYYESDIIIPAKTIHTYPIEVTFQNDLLLRDDAGLDHIVQPEIEIEYVKDQNQKKTSKKLTAVYAMGKGKISWTNTELAASFITVDHPSVAEFARNAVKENYTKMEQFGMNNEIGRAMVIFDYLSQYGIRYNPDKTTPFVKVAGNEEVFDHIQYPVELLESKIGDCDDCSVLYSALLENLGINTCLLDVFAPNEGHIYVMFDTDITVEEASHVFVSSDEYVAYQGKAWLPVEITLLGKSFYEAYEFGMKEFERRSKAGQLNIVNVNQARRVYKAGEVEERKITLPSLEETASMITGDFQAFNVRYDRVCGLNNDDNNDIDDYDKGSCYLYYRQYQKAEKYFLQSVEKNYKNADAYNALGVIATKMKKYDQAGEYIQKALEIDRDNQGYLMNFAILYFLSGKKTEALELLEKLENLKLPDKNLNELKSLMK